MWPLILDYTRDECVRFLREMELKAYEQIVTAFRAQGNLCDGKRQLLNDLRNFLSISIERHQAEIRRVTNDEKLTTIAHFLSESEDNSSEWLTEGKRLVPLLPRLVPQNPLTELADQVAADQYKLNQRMPEPCDTSRKRGVDEPVPEAGKKMRAESITIRRKATPSSPKPIKFPTPVPIKTTVPEKQKPQKQPVVRKTTPARKEKHVTNNRTVRHVTVPVSTAVSGTGAGAAASGRVIFLQSANQQQIHPQITGQVRITNPSAAAVSSNNCSSLTAQSIQSVKQPANCGQPVIFLSANSLQRLAACPPNQSSLTPSASSSSNVSSSLTMTRSSNQTAGQMIYQTTTNSKTGRANLILFPSKGNATTIVPLSSNGRSEVSGASSSNGLSHNNRHYGARGTSSNSNTNDRSHRSHVVTLPSDLIIRPQIAPHTVLKDKGQTGDKGRSTVINGLTGVRIPDSVSLTSATASCSSGQATAGTTVNPQRNVIEIQASGEVLECLKRNGQLSPDIIALVQKAVSMANGASGNQRSQSESQTINVIPHLPKLPAQTVITTISTECQEQNCDPGPAAVIDD